ncbi:hypothetical protein Z043_126285 [Scleropages formosus]|uniref:Uncharacterized protein n=1 Tax=Scleropages formosus TaxID=113540 RepID=A0A0P7TRS7_SCLFO|nr:hypothetical protein Z043_126285 [Scleropages formosus]
MLAAVQCSNAMVDMIWQYQFRVILLGDSTVGKSSLLKRFTDGVFSDAEDPTVGVDFYTRTRWSSNPNSRLNYSCGTRPDRSVLGDW